jgi:DNA-binding transcriptional LysR family regulator
MDRDRRARTGAPVACPCGRPIAKTLADEGVETRNTLAVDYSHVVRKLVERGCGLALVDEFSVWDAAEAPCIALRRFLPRIPVSIGLIVPQRRPLSIAARAFVDEVRKTLSTPPL